MPPETNISGWMPSNARENAASMEEQLFPEAFDESIPLEDRRVSVARWALDTLEHCPVFNLGPTADDGQVLPAEIAWVHFMMLHSGLSESPEEVYIASRDRGNRSHFDGLWKWSVYLYGEFLRGTRIVHSSEEWSQLFLTVELIFGKFDKMGPDWNAWIETTPPLLRLLTDLWKSQITRGPERSSLAFKDFYHCPISRLICSTQSSRDFSDRWCSIAGGADHVTDILLSRINDGSPRARKDSARDKIDEIYSLQILEAMTKESAEPSKWELSLLFRGGAQRIAKCMLSCISQPLEFNYLTLFGYCGAITTCLAVRSFVGLKQALAGDALTTLLNAVLDHYSLHPLTQNNTITFVDWVRMNLIHYSIFCFACRSIDSVRERYQRIRRLDHAPLVLESIRRLFHAVDYRLLEFPRNESVQRTFRKQVCGFTKCEHAFRVSLSRLSPQCYTMLFGPEQLVVDPAFGSRLFSECAGCERVSYCSGSCQQQHWRSHKKHCHAIQSLRRKDRVVLNEPKNYEKELLQCMVFFDVHRNIEDIRSMKLAFLRLHPSLSPLLFLLEIRYHEHDLDNYDSRGEAARPFSLSFRKLGDVLVEKGYDEASIAHHTYQVVMEGVEFYVIQYFVGSNSIQEMLRLV